jgi:hypothetical protein
MDPGTITPPVPRNSPCPCGSGLRYKMCHGAQAQDPSAPFAGRRLSSYRAPLREWPDMSEAERDALGVIMERALAHQRAGRIDNAEHDYLTVLERAPDTHDALHMLGVIELGRDNLDEAERLIRRAMALRSPHPAIVRNLKLVDEAKLVFRRESPELLCERALPIFADLVLGEPVGGRGTGTGPRAARTASGEVHLIGRVEAPMQNDGWLFRRLAQLIDARLWAIDAAGAGHVAERPWHGIDAAIGSYPRGGTQVIVGINASDFEWLDHSGPSRLIVFCMGGAPSARLDLLRRVARDGARNVELVFFSASEAGRFGLGHQVLVPPVEVPLPELAPAKPEVPAKGVWRIEKPAPFRIGMVGQSGLAVLDATPDDIAQALRNCVDELVVYDPGRLRFVFGDARNVRFVPRTLGGLHSFLSGLDALVMRPCVWYYEDGMQEFFSARALGLPVLCPETSRWAEYVEDGMDGLCFDSHEQLQRLVGELKVAPGWARDVGDAARTRTLALLEAGEMRRSYAEFFGRGAGGSLRDGGAQRREEST